MNVERLVPFTPVGDGVEAPSGSVTVLFTTA